MIIMYRTCILLYMLDFAIPNVQECKLNTPYLFASRIQYVARIKSSLCLIQPLPYVRLTHLLNGLFYIVSLNCASISDELF
jgi:hypothetical protein